MKKNQTIEIVNRKYTNPRNIIAAFTEKLSQQSVLEGVGGPFGLDIADVTDDADSDDLGTSVPSEPVSSAEEEVSIDSIEEGSTFEEELVLSGGLYYTSLPFEFFKNVWFDGLLAIYNEHWTISGTQAIVTNIPLLDGTEVIARYVVGTI